ncbi:head maturation protease [Gordonia phage GMA2]|uniref:Putative structural protein n=1 Tax=Gordonia phage GMA2 TaxID=1647283 RepID=A0A0K0N719_9CAUD|nr:head maturation protease [Gordonia phage GMA2]AKJ72548.1 putative structural protein [Gordonia phage GMA2]
MSNVESSENVAQSASETPNLETNSFVEGDYVTWQSPSGETRSGIVEGYSGKNLVNVIRDSGITVAYSADRLTLATDDDDDDEPLLRMRPISSAEEFDAAISASIILNEDLWYFERLAKTFGREIAITAAGPKRVRTAAGAKKYGVPIGSPINAAKMQKASKDSIAKLSSNESNANSDLSWTPSKDSVSAFIKGDKAPKAPKAPKGESFDVKHYLLTGEKKPITPSAKSVKQVTPDDLFEDPSWEHVKLSAGIKAFKKDVGDNRHVVYETPHPDTKKYSWHIQSISTHKIVKQGSGSTFSESFQQYESAAKIVELKAQSKSSDDAFKAWMKADAEEMAKKSSASASVPKTAPSKEFISNKQVTLGKISNDPSEKFTPKKTLGDGTHPVVGAKAIDADGNVGVITDVYQTYTKMKLDSSGKTVQYNNKKLNGASQNTGDSPVLNNDAGPVDPEQLMAAAGHDPRSRAYQKSKLPDVLIGDSSHAWGTKERPMFFPSPDKHEKAWLKYGLSLTPTQNKAVWKQQDYESWKRISDFTFGSSKYNSHKPEYRDPAAMKAMDAAFDSHLVKPMEHWAVFSRGSSHHELPPSFGIEDTGKYGGFSGMSGIQMDKVIEQINSNAGKEYYEPLVKSSAVTAEVPGQFKSCFRILYKVPPGTKAIYVAGDKKGHVLSEYGQVEREAILPKSRRRVISASRSPQNSETIDLVIEILPESEESGVTAAALIASVEDDHSEDGMIALLPREEDAKDLAVQSGTTPEELHLTLAYFKSANDMPSDATISRKLSSVFGESEIIGAVGGYAVFHPHDEQKTCKVYLVQADGLSKANKSLRSEVGDYDAYTPHITAVTGQQARSAELSETAEVTFDRVRIARRGEYRDLPLSDLFKVVVK